MRFDAQCDVAAVVYRADDDPDRLLADFARDLRRAGLRPVGIVQAGRNCQAENPRLGVMVLPGGDSVCLVSDSACLGPEGEGCGTRCRLDAARLAELARRLGSAIEHGADLVVINRFGRLEAEGGGLVDLIALALDTDIPVLIAVPERRFPDWIRFSGGMNVKLACRRAALDRWWQSVVGTEVPRRSRAVSTFCELAK